jgi:integrase
VTPRTGHHKPYLRADGVTVYRVDTGRITSDGTRVRLTVSSRDPATAKRKYRDLLRRLNAGDIPTPGSQRMTVKRWADEWMPMHAAKVRPHTYDTDAGAMRKWIIPTIGHRKLADLTPADLRNLTTAITGAGRSTTTALHAHRVLRTMLKAAHLEGHEVPDRVVKVPLPGKAANDRDAMPLEHLVRVLAIAGQRDDAARWMLALLYGVRQGEALGLEWSRVEAGSVDLSWQLQHLTKSHTVPDGWEARHITGSAWWTRPKTRAGIRILPLVPFMAALLEGARATWEPNPWGLLWVEDGKPIRSEHDRARWHDMQREAGVAHPSGRPWHVHECRHSAATMLKQQGASDQLVASILGQKALVQSYIHAGDRDEMTRVLGGVADMLGLTGPQIAGK